MKNKLDVLYELETAREIQVLINKIKSIDSDMTCYSQLIKELNIKKHTFQMQLQFLRSKNSDMTLEGRQHLEDKWKGKRRPTGCRK